MVSLEDLCKPLTPEQVRSTIYAILAQVGISTTNWKPGAVVRTIIAFVALIFSAFTYWSSRAIRGVWLLLARGDWLTVCARYDYSTERLLGAFANGPVSLVNSKASVYDFEAGELTIKYVSTADGKTYKYHNTAAFSLNGNTTATMTIQAEVIGTAANIPASATVTLEPSYDGLTVQIPVAIMGSDVETDQQLINRAMLAPSSESPNGPLDAYQYKILKFRNASGNQVATKVAVVKGSPVQVYAGNPTGVISSEDLAALKILIETTVVPLGVNATLSAATQFPIAIAYDVWCRATTLSASDIHTYIRTSVAELIADTPIGGNPATTDSGHATGTRWLYYDSVKAAVEKAIANVQGVSNPIFHASVTLNSGTADLEMTAANDLVLSNLSGTVHAS